MMTKFWQSAGRALLLALSGSLFVAWTSGAAQAQAAPPVDYLGIPGPIEFAGTPYRLVWSARPAANYIKHEYLPSGQQPASYQDMVLVEMQTSSLGVADLVKSQILSLEERKGKDPLVNYQLLQNPNNSQVVLDFLLSDRRTGTLIVEWNAYRYVQLAMPNGKQAVVLFAISRRHYGDDPTVFLKALQARRAADINTLVKHAVPGVEAEP
jgi:hypothetical protein